ncbi:MAG: cell wall anchor protein [Ruminococcaceae bacterium]|nr:cell wall anchor protein [Oscillospiraceae bacterium]
MKRIITLCAALALCAALSLPAFAADSGVCYPTAVEQSEDGTQLKRIYDLTPEADPAGISRSDFERGGFHYTLVELLRQELPANESRQHTETVTLQSEKKDMESVLALLPQEREFVTDDGLTGTLTLKLDTVRVEVSGYGSATRQLTATRAYPNLIGQDTQFIPKSIEDGGRTLTLESIDWRTDNTANVDGYGLGDRYTAVATYTGSVTSSYVKGYTVTADYVGTVSRIALDRVRYVAIFEGTRIAGADEPEEISKEIAETTPAAEQTDGAPAQFPWRYVLVPIGVIAVVGVGLGAALTVKRRSETSGAVDTEEDAE